MASENTNESEKANAVSPITEENLIVITELANIGLSYIEKTLIPHLEKAKEDKHLEYAKFLSSVGKDTIAHFDTICRYLFDANQKKDDAKSDQ